jgi:NhaP-type Na+/H+ or K+/H+ antiporter
MINSLNPAGGGPEDIVNLMEGEALMNDASGVTVYVILMSILESYPAGQLPSVTSQIGTIAVDIFK